VSQGLAQLINVLAQLSSIRSKPHPLAPDLCPVAEGSVRADHGEEDERWEDVADDTSRGGTGQRQYRLHVGHQESNGERPCNYRDCNEVEDPGWNGLGTGRLLEKIQYSSLFAGEYYTTFSSSILKEHTPSLTPSQ
jgi:hypothetical protein